MSEEGRSAGAGAGANAGSAVEDLLEHGGLSAWALAALALVLDEQVPEAVHVAAEGLLAARGVRIPASGDGPARELLGVRAASALRQPLEALGSATGWDQMPDQVLLEQGRASALGAQVLSERLLPRLEGLVRALESPGARMLDVGTGTAALAVAYARAWPRVRVLGLDVLPRALDLGRAQVAAGAVDGRVELRLQSVADLEDVEAFDLAWVPAPFIDPQALAAGLVAVARALRPGGWVLVGHARLGQGAAADALTRLQTALHGGSALGGAQVVELLTGTGLVEVRTVPTPPGAPAITVARRAA